MVPREDDLSAHSGFMTCLRSLDLLRPMVPFSSFRRCSRTRVKSRLVSFSHVFLLIVACLPAGGCHIGNDGSNVRIEFTTIPEAREGGPEGTTGIAGRVTGAHPNEKIVLFAKSEQWWVQPAAENVFTPIQPDSTWSNSTHYGWEYAALLVEPGYRPPLKTLNLPVGSAIRATAVVKGLPGPAQVFKTLHFGGYDWKVRSSSSNRGGGTVHYDPANAWTDASGALHFRITMNSGQWGCAEVSMLRSLGYGTYRLVVRDTSVLEPAAVLAMFTWDDRAPEQSYREFDVEITRWGDPANKNTQFVVQPYYVPANVARFVTPTGPMTYSMQWEPEKLSFQALHGDGKTNHPQMIAEHTFTSGIPTPGNESVHLNLYIYTSSLEPLKKPTEVVLEKFEYLP
jgi:hypothetical protein